VPFFSLFSSASDLPPASYTMCASRSSSLARGRVIERKNKMKWESRKHERSRSRLAFLKNGTARDF
jgi:hypothetical protein